MRRKEGGKAAEMPPAMILCGGMGTRMRDVTELLPKPMVPIGPQPIVWHIMKCYAAFGVKRFILCLGYKREEFITYFLNYHARATDVTVKLGPGSEIVYHDHSGEEDWEVTLANTGYETMTGGRVARAAKYLKNSDKDFFLTYGDAVADIDFDKLLKAHRRDGTLATVSAVHPAGRFGEVNIEGGKIAGFTEKPQMEKGYINGGFMVFKRGFVSKYLPDDPSLVLEQEPIRKAVKDGELAAYVHEGFWQCMDTAREHQLLNDMWKKGSTPWTKHWN